MFFLFALLVAVVNAQDVLLYPSSIRVNGTNAKILVENDALCVTPSIQFNGSSSLFASNRNVWVRGADAIYKKSSFTYGDFVQTNPATLPVFMNWWVFPCLVGDTSGIISSANYIPLNATYGITASCLLELPVVYACEGNVPSTQSPTRNPTRSPTQPTRLPTRNPTQSPTREPTKVPTSGGDLAKLTGFIWFIIWFLYI